MINEKIQFNNVPDENLNNEDYIYKVFVSGTKEELAKIAQHHNLSHEQITLFTYFAKLKKETQNEMREIISERIKNNPRATDAELNMGTYQEWIEPQVREAVLNLRQKGYNTYESGFGGFDSQMISFEDDCLKDFKIPEQIINKFKESGVTINIKPNRISLIFKNEFNLEEIANFWREVESCLPDLGKVAEPCQLRAANLFRERQKN
jgi:hypothetical protein